MEALERATVCLSEQVSGLNSALLAVGDIASRQTRVEQKQEQLNAVVVPREEMERRAVELQAAVDDYRKRFVTRLITGGLALLALLGVLSVVAVNYIAANQKRNYQACLSENRDRENSRGYLLAVRDNSTNPVLREAATEASKNYHPLDCGALR